MIWPRGISDGKADSRVGHGMRKSIASLCAALVLGCSSAATEVTSAPGTLGPGTWGGPSVGLTITATEAAAHFDFCAEGTLKVPILLTPDGRFDVSGTYARNIGPSINRFM